MTNIKLLILTILSMLIVVGTVQGQPYNTTENPIAFATGVFNCQPLDPKIACSETSPDICIMAYYENNAGCTRGVKVFYSVDGFQTPNECTSGWFGSPDNIHCFYRGSNAVDWSDFATDVTFKPNYHLPFDVVYDNKGIGTIPNAFYIAIEDKLYRYHTNDGSSMNDTAVSDLPILTVTEDSPPIPSKYKFWTAGWDNDDVESMFVVGSNVRVQSVAGLPRAYHALARAEYNLTSGSYTDRAVTDATSSICNPSTFCLGGAGCPNVWIIEKLMYYSAPISGNDFAFNYTVNSTTQWTAGACSTYNRKENGDSNFNAPSGIDATHHEFRDDLYALDTSTGIYAYEITGDYASFGASSFIYQQESSIAEIVNFSDSDSTSTREVMAWFRSSNSTGNGIYVYQNVLVPFRIRGKQFSPVSETLFLQDAVISAGLTCSDGYSTSGSGSQFDLGSSCTEDVTLFYNALDLNPSSSSNTIDVPPWCEDQLIVNYIAISGNYLMPIEVRDDITGEVIPNATVTIDGSSTNITDSQGIAYISVNPITGAYFVESFSSSGCILNLEASGIPREFLIDVEHPDYLDYSDIVTFAEEESDGSVQFEYKERIRMTPDAGILIVHLVTTDGVEIFPENAEMRAYGADDTYIILDDTNKFHQNIATEFPAEYLFLDNNSQFDINLTLRYFDQMFYKNVTEISNDGLGVIKGSLREVEFPVEVQSYNASCLTSDDCLDSYCVDSTYAQLIGCNIESGSDQGKCEYSFDSCTFCDERIGCYDLATTDSCSDHLDCLNQSYCISQSKSRTGLCGNDGFCLYKDIICDSPDFCDSDLELPTNESAGMCRQTFLCVLTGGIREKFTIRVPTNNLERLLTGEDFKDVVDVDFSCNIETAGTKVCVDGYLVSEEEAQVGVVTFPENWAYNVNQTTGVDFYDIAVSCSDGCNISYQYCPYGCAGGDCLTSPLSTEAGVRNFIQAIQGWWATMFPTIWDQAFMWTIITLLGSLGIAGGLGFVMRGGSGGLGGQEIGSVFLGSAISLFLLGSFIGTMPIFISVVFSILAGFLVWQIWK